MTPNDFNHPAFLLRAVAILIKSWLVSVLGKVFIQSYETRPPTHFLHFTAHRFWKTDQPEFFSSFFFRENRINRLVSDWFSVTTGKVEYYYFPLLFQTTCREQHWLSCLLIKGSRFRFCVWQGIELSQKTGHIRRQKSQHHLRHFSKPVCSQTCLSLVVRVLICSLYDSSRWLA